MLEEAGKRTAGPLEASEQVEEDEGLVRGQGHHQIGAGHGLSLPFAYIASGLTVGGARATAEVRVQV